MELPRNLELSTAQIIEQSYTGVHGALICISAPAAAALGPLSGKVLTVLGTYRCVIPIAGLKSSVQVHLRATIVTTTVTSSGPDSLAQEAEGDTNANIQLHIRTAGTGDGALVSATAQTATLVPGGEKWALYDLVLSGGAGTVTITRAEYNGK